MAKKTEDTAGASAQGGDTPPLSMNSTKKEMLDAYEAVLKKLQEKREAQLRPEQAVEERKAQQVTKAADGLSSESVVQGIANLKVTVGKMLSGLADQLEGEVARYQRTKAAVELREKELEEIYGIEKAAGTLAALIETQNQKRADFEAEMAAEKEELSRDIEVTRAEWDKEKREHDEQEKLRAAVDERNRARQKDEYDYAFKREQRLAKDQFTDETGRLQKEMAERKQQAEKDLAERQRVVVAREEQIKQLQAQVDGFPAELEKAVARAVKEAVDRKQAEAKGREELMQKEFDGERKSLATRIDGLEKTVADQNGRIAKMSQQLDGAYQKVQDIAVKAIEGSANMKTLNEVQRALGERGRAQGQE